MTSVRKQYANRRSMPIQSRNSAYAALNILWLQMRPDLKWESKDVIREERLIWIAGLLGLKRELKSTKDLTDGQIGLVLDEMKRLTGSGRHIPQAPATPQQTNVIKFPKPDNVVYLSAERASEEQIYTIRKILEYLGWSEEVKTDFLTKRGFPVDISKLRFKKAHPLMMILLNAAAHKDLKANGKPTGRAACGAHIKIIKRKLQIGD